MSCCIKAHTQQDAKILRDRWSNGTASRKGDALIKENPTGLNKPETNKAGCSFGGKVCLAGLVD